MDIIHLRNLQGKKCLQYFPLMHCKLNPVLHETYDNHEACQGHALLIYLQSSLPLAVCATIESILYFGELDEFC